MATLQVRNDHVEGEWSPHDTAKELARLIKNKERGHVRFPHKYCDEVRKSLYDLGYNIFNLNTSDMNGMVFRFGREIYDIESDGRGNSQSKCGEMATWIVDVTDTVNQ